MFKSVKQFNDQLEQFTKNIELVTKNLEQKETHPKYKLVQSKQFTKGRIRKYENN